MKKQRLLLSSDGQECICIYSHLLVTVPEAPLSTGAGAGACVLTVVLHLWLGWVSAQRAHPLSPARQENKKPLRILFHSLVKHQMSQITIWKASSLTRIKIAGNLKPVALDILHWICIWLEVKSFQILFMALLLSQRKRKWQNCVWNHLPAVYAAALIQVLLWQKTLRKNRQQLVHKTYPDFG